jgi:hypothetical protein
MLSLKIQVAVDILQECMGVPFFGYGHGDCLHGQYYYPGIFRMKLA